MNEQTIYIVFKICFIVPVMYAIMFMVKYHYISTVCREWNKKLYEYIQHLKSQKDSENISRNYKYLEDMYLYPDEIGIFIFKNWKESDLIMDKLTLFNVNRYHSHQAKQVC